MAQPFQPRLGARGFLLQEVMVGLLIFGIAMYPIVRALLLLPQIAATADEQARAESWRSASDSLVSLGIDATQTRSLQLESADFDVSDLRIASARVVLAAQPGSPRISLLTEQGSLIAESRALPAGIEIGADPSPPELRSDPLTPLPAVKIANPTLSPSSGSFMNVTALVPFGNAYGVKLHSAAANGGDRVFLRESGPENQSTSAVADASLIMTANSLAHALTGSTWSEYAGSQETDTKVDVGDGRARWLVKAGQQIQVYEPSDLVGFIYGVDLGRPVFNLAGTEYSSGSAVSVNFVQARAIEQGVVSALIAYPQDVAERFGQSWANVEPQFQWTFGSVQGDSSGERLSTIFSAAGRNSWSDHQTLTVEPKSTLAGVRAWTGTWTLSRDAITLSAPDRSSDFYDGSTDDAGIIDFAAPVLNATGTRVGRPEIDGVESVSDTISISVVP